MRTIAVVNQKGGVAKTTTAHHLGVALAQQGRQVLLVDADPQAVLTFNCGLVPDSERLDLADVLLAALGEEEGVGIADVALPVMARMRLVPSSQRLSYIRRDLQNAMHREYLLRDALAAMAEDADFALIDCPPNLDEYTLNALAAAGEVLVPVSTEVNSLVGLARMEETIALVRRRLNPALILLGILPTCHMRGHAMPRLVLESLEREWAAAPLFAPIPRSTDFLKASAARESLMTYLPDSPGAVAYRALAKEIDHERETARRSRTA